MRPVQLRPPLRDSQCPVAVALLGDLAACAPPLGSATWPGGGLPACPEGAPGAHSHDPRGHRSFHVTRCTQAQGHCGWAKNPSVTGSAPAGNSVSLEARQLAREEAQAASLVLAARLLLGTTLWRASRRAS